MRFPEKKPLLSKEAIEDQPIRTVSKLDKI
jgi:hypothetical protein